MLKNFLYWWQDHDEDKPITIREMTIRAIYEPLDEYVDWACEQGMSLPPDYAKDPTAWNEILRHMQRAFRLLNEELEGEGDLWKAKNEWKEFGEQDADKIKEIEKDIQGGLTLFGKYLFYLTEEIVDRGPAH